MEAALIPRAAALILFAASVVSAMEVNISRDTCGVTKLCFETPEDCDPAGETDCLFGSLMDWTPETPNNTNLFFQLRGNSMGYIGLGLTGNETEGATTLFICAQNSSDNGTFIFRTMMLNNTDATLTPAGIDITDVQGVVENNVIRCEFNLTMMNASNSSISSNPDNSLIVLLGKGSVDGDTFGTFNITLNSGPIDWSDLYNNTVNTTTTTTTPLVTHSPNTTTMANTTTLANTTTIANTTSPNSGASSVLNSHALTVLLTVLTLSIIWRA